MNTSSQKTLFQCTMRPDPEVQDLTIFNSNHILFDVSWCLKCLDEISGASGLILGFPESVEAPKDASENGLSQIAGDLALFDILFLCLVLVQRRQSSWSHQRRLSNTNSAAYLRSIHQTFIHKNTYYVIYSFWGYGLSRIGYETEQRYFHFLLRKHERRVSGWWKW